MLCFEVYVNDKKVCTAGHEELDEITTLLKYQKSERSIKLTASGQLFEKDSLSGHASWLIRIDNKRATSIRELKIGDEVRIVINDDLNPDNPAFYKSGKEETSSGTNIYCSFCGMEQRKVKTMIAKRNAYICNECIDLYNEIIEEENRS